MTTTKKKMRRRAAVAAPRWKPEGHFVRLSLLTHVQQLRLAVITVVVVRLWFDSTRLPMWPTLIHHPMTMTKMTKTTKAVSTRIEAGTVRKNSNSSRPITPTKSRVSLNSKWRSNENNENSNRPTLAAKSANNRPTTRSCRASTSLAVNVSRCLPRIKTTFPNGSPPPPAASGWNAWSRDGSVRIRPCDDANSSLSCWICKRRIVLCSWTTAIPTATTVTVMAMTIIWI
mmetsp:Transcript_10670/g.29405  ORF Transcript_10670/g.29405 Transcript_10670/m.29405 type:complete len:229 (-) Transcript_10670:134-820(-)